MAGVRPDEEADLEQALAFSVHLPFEPDDWRAAAFLERTLRAEGLTIPRNDIFVATVAIRANLSVICRDTHFNAIAEAAHTTLRVEQV